MTLTLQQAARLPRFGAGVAHLAAFGTTPRGKRVTIVCGAKPCGGASASHEASECQPSRDRRIASNTENTAPTSASSRFHIRDL